VGAIGLLGVEKERRLFQKAIGGGRMHVGAGAGPTSWEEGRRSSWLVQEEKPGHQRILRGFCGITTLLK